VADLNALSSAGDVCCVAAVDADKGRLSGNESPRLEPPVADAAGEEKDD